jgi:hypothetical protein
LAFSRTQRASADEELAGLEAGITGVFLGLDFDLKPARVDTFGASPHD